MQDLRIVATAIMIQKESGGNLAEVLDKTSLCDSRAVPAEEASADAHRPGTADGLDSEPVAGGAGSPLYFVNPDMMSILWTRPLGIKLLWTSVGMTMMGGLIIRHIVNMDV